MLGRHKVSVKKIFSSPSGERDELLIGIIIIINENTFLSNLDLKDKSLVTR